MTRTTLLGSSFVAAMTVLAWSTPMAAQTISAGTQSSPDTTSDERPTTTTFLGDTGIWYVPTAEILRNGTWSAGGGRRGTNYPQGATNVADFTGSIAAGIGNHVEVFGALLFDTRVKRNQGPVFTTIDAREGGVVARYPGVDQRWTGNSVGDLYVGTKLNILSQYRQAPMALAVRGIVKLPTGNTGAGVSTGKADVMADVIASRELAQLLEVSTFVGYEIRGNPTGLDTPNASYRWGTGVAFPSRTALRLSAEVNGDLPNDYRATLTDGALVANDGSLPPFESDIKNRTRATGGVTYQMPRGFYVGTGLSWNAPRHWDWQMRVGFHGRGRNQPRSFASETVTAPVAAAPVPTSSAALELPVATPRAEAVSPPAAAVVAVAATPQAPIAPIAPTSYTFEDVYFNLDGVTPRPEATAVLDGALMAMRADPTLTMTVEGHTCDIGTPLYNMALAQRRANAVSDYFVSRGIAANRLRTVSYGEDAPEHANAHEATKRLNRRVALVVQLQR